MSHTTHRAAFRIYKALTTAYGRAARHAQVNGYLVRATPSYRVPRPYSTSDFASPAPTYHPLPAQREQAEVQEDGQAHAEHDADHYPEEATPTQRRTLSSPLSPLRTPHHPARPPSSPLPSSVR